MKKIIPTVILCIIPASFLWSIDFKPINIPEGYEHNKWRTMPEDILFEFAAYTTSFDSDDDNSGNGTSDIWGIPEWVSFEIRRTEKKYPSERPSSWITPADLFSRGITPDDSTYRVSGTAAIREVKSDYRFVRGHMCPKSTAERISEYAAWNTHTILNAVPQLQWQNNGIWKYLEQQCEDWSDEYGRIWVICGPVFFGKKPAMWLGQEGEIKAAIPDALFKIVIREDGDCIRTVCFLIPNILPKESSNYWEYQTTIRRVEELAGLDFFTVLDEDFQNIIENELYFRYF